MNLPFGKDIKVIKQLIIYKLIKIIYKSYYQVFKVIYKIIIKIFLLYSDPALSLSAI